MSNVISFDSIKHGQRVYFGVDGEVYGVGRILGEKNYEDDGTLLLIEVEELEDPDTDMFETPVGFEAHEIESNYLDRETLEKKASVSEDPTVAKYIFFPKDSEGAPPMLSPTFALDKVPEDKGTPDPNDGMTIYDYLVPVD